MDEKRDERDQFVPRPACQREADPGSWAWGHPACPAPVPSDEVIEMQWRERRKFDDEQRKKPAGSVSDERRDSIRVVR